jgi:hypothetical protein
MQILLQQIQSGLDKEQSGLILNFLVALYKCGWGYMSPSEGADWAITPLPGLTFDDVEVFQHITEDIHINKE